MQPLKLEIDECPLFLYRTLERAQTVIDNSVYQASNRLDHVRRLERLLRKVKPIAEAHAKECWCEPK